MAKSTTIFQAGDKVKMTGKFLRSTGQVVGGEGSKVWTVMAFTDDSFLRMVIVDELLSPEMLKYFSDAELAADPSLKYRRINALNLVLVSR